MTLNEKINEAAAKFVTNIMYFPKTYDNYDIRILDTEYNITMNSKPYSFNPEGKLLINGTYAFTVDPGSVIETYTRFIPTELKSDDTAVFMNATEKSAPIEFRIGSVVYTKNYTLVIFKIICDEVAEMPIMFFDMAGMHFSKNFPTGLDDTIHDSARNPILYPNETKSTKYVFTDRLSALSDIGIA